MSIRQHTSTHLHRRVAASARRHTACYMARTGLCPNSGIAVKATCQPLSLGDRASHCKKKKYLLSTSTASLSSSVTRRSRLSLEMLQQLQQSCNRAATELQQSCNRAATELQQLEALAALARERRSRGCGGEIFFSCDPASRESGCEWG